MSGDATMTALVHYELAPGACELRERPVPEIGPDDVLLRVGAVGICGSDVHQYHNTHSWAVNTPVILGHEFCGTVERVGERVTGFAPGDRVVSETAARVDPASPFTRAGRYNLDPARRGFGYGVDGAMAPFVQVPARLLHRLPAGLDDRIAALTEPCCVAYSAVVENAPVRPGDVVVVLGPGPIGLLCAQMARLCGAGEVVMIGVERDRARLDLATRHWATRALVAGVDDVDSAIRELGDGYGADVVIDASGASAALQGALRWVRPEGHVTKVGWGPQPLGFSLDPLVQKAVTLKGSFSHTYGTWERVIRLLASGALDPAPLVSRTAPLDGWRACFDGMGAGELIKAVLLPGDPRA
jgi:alcohol dehydrogenase/L-iditol 2-dehydrogenase